MMKQSQSLRYTTNKYQKIYIVILSGELFPIYLLTIYLKLDKNQHIFKLTSKIKLEVESKIVEKKYFLTEQFVF